MFGILTPIVEGYLIKFTDVGKKLGFGFSPYAGWSSGDQKDGILNDLVEANCDAYIRKILHEVRAKKGLINGI